MLLYIPKINKIVDKKVTETCLKSETDTETSLARVARQPFPNSGQMPITRTEKDGFGHGQVQTK